MFGADGTSSRMTRSTSGVACLLNSAMLMTNRVTGVTAQLTSAACTAHGTVSLHRQDLTCFMFTASRHTHTARHCCFYRCSMVHVETDCTCLVPPHCRQQAWLEPQWAALWINCSCTSGQSLARQRKDVITATACKHHKAHLKAHHYKGYHAVHMWQGTTVMPLELQQAADAIGSASDLISLTSCGCIAATCCQNISG